MPNLKPNTKCENRMMLFECAKSDIKLFHIMLHVLTDCVISNVPSPTMLVSLFMTLKI